MVPLRVFVFQLPVIIDLRNPSLKPRHWTSIEQIVDATLVDLKIPLTLEKLSELHVFDFGQEIQDISGQASGEAALETILKKVNLKIYIFLRSRNVEIFISPAWVIWIDFSTVQLSPYQYQLSFCFLIFIIIIIIILTSANTFFLLSL